MTKESISQILLITMFAIFIFSFSWFLFRIYHLVIPTSKPVFLICDKEYTKEVPKIEGQQQRANSVYCYSVLTAPANQNTVDQEDKKKTDDSTKGNHSLFSTILLGVISWIFSKFFSPVITHWGKKVCKVPN